MNSFMAEKYKLKELKIVLPGIEDTIEELKLQKAKREKEKKEYDKEKSLENETQPIAI